MTDTVKLFDLTKKFVIDIWGLERDLDALPRSDETYKFPPNDAKIEATRIVFDRDQIRVKSFAWDSHYIRFESDKMITSFNGFSTTAADPLYFEYVLINIAQLATVASIGWDTEAKFGEYTRARVKYLTTRKKNGTHRNRKS